MAVRGGEVLRLMSLGGCELAILTLAMISPLPGVEVDRADKKSR